MPSQVHSRLRNKELTPERNNQIRILLSKECDCCGFRPTQEQIARKFNISRSIVAKIGTGDL